MEKELKSCTGVLLRADLTGHSHSSPVCQNGWDGRALLGQPSKGHPCRILIMFYYIISTTYQKIGDLFSHVHISGLSHSVPTTNHNFNYGAGATFYVTCSLLPLTFGKLLVFYWLFLVRSTHHIFH